MIRTLLIIAGASLVLCIVTVGGAAAVGGRDLASHNWTWTFPDNGEMHTVHFERGDDGPTVSRTLAWTGGDRLQVEIPGDVAYIQGPTASVVVTGQKSLVDKVRLVDGRLTWNDAGRQNDHLVFGWNVHDRLHVVVTAPSVNRFDLESSADLSIRDYDQPTLALDVSGSGDVEASGKTGAATLDISGSSETDLSAMTITDANVSISGSGDVRVGPTGSARIDISGSGDVDLTQRPARLEQDISGSGDINQQ